MIVPASFNCRRFLLNSLSHLKGTPFFIIMYIGLVKSAYLGIHFLLNPKNPNKPCSDFLSLGAWSSVRALAFDSIVVYTKAFLIYHDANKCYLFFQKITFYDERAWKTPDEVFLSVPRPCLMTTEGRRKNIQAVQKVGLKGFCLCTWKIEHHLSCVTL